MESPRQKEMRIHAAVLEFVKNNANGCTMTNLVRGTKFSRKAIEKHLQILILENEIYMKQFGVTKVYYPNRKIQHLDSEKLTYGNRTIWFDILENEYGRYLLIQKKKKTGNKWAHEHSLTIPLERSNQFMRSLQKVLRSPEVQELSE